MNANQMRMEKIIDPSVDPEGAAAQTAQPWCSVHHGGWIVVGTDDIREARDFAAEVAAAAICDGEK